MHRIIIRLFILLALIAALAGAAYAMEYFWFTNEEMTVFGDRIKFWHGDTLDGPIRTNSTFAIMEDPVFLDLVISCGGDYWHGPGYNPQFFGPLPIFNADSMHLPFRADQVREGAVRQGLYFDDFNTQYLARFLPGVIVFYSWPLGIPCDSSQYTTINLTDPACVFCEGPIRVLGRVQGQATLGSASDILIEDDVRYVDADVLTGRTPTTSTNMLGLIAEHDIKIRNTPANGRWNSNGLGYNQSNRDSTSVVITAALHALGGSFTFEQQNDPDSGYVCFDCPGDGRDERGTIYVYGSIWQRRRGYAHRATRGSTGYLKNYRYDQRFRQTRPPCFRDMEDWYSVQEDTIYFGNVPVNSTVWDTLHVDVIEPTFLSAVYATYPFYAVRQPPYNAMHYAIPVSFSPPHIAPFSGVLSVGVGDALLQIPLRGRGVAPGAPLVMALAPNPCNLSTTLRYSLPAAGQVKLTLYDVLGRVAKQVDVEMQVTGEHALHLDLAGLASGVYFTQLEAAHQRVTQKLLLLK